MTKQQIIEINKTVERRQSDRRMYGGYDFEYLDTLSAGVAMDEWASQFAYDFAKFLEEHTEIIREEKITLYRYNSPHDGWGNYILEDILTEFKEKYEG
jgi:hypothetical protein